MRSAEALVGTAFVGVLVCLGVLGANPSRATRITAALEEHYNRVRSLQAQFIQRYTLGRTTRVESGTVYFQKPGKMRWEYESPEEKLFLSDGRYVYLYVPSEQQVSRSRLGEAGDWRAPFGLLLGRIDFSKLFSRVEIKPISRPGQATFTQLRGLPKSARQGFAEIWLDVNVRQEVERIEIRQPDGVVMEFHFREWRENLPLAPDLFRLRVPPGTVKNWVGAPLSP
ncbi:MAG: outer membrane lipoprotein carrier protein LolA [Terriglobia bacterium]